MDVSEQINMLDKKDQEIYMKRYRSVIRGKDPIVGDWVIMPDGKYTRVTHIWDFRDDVEDPIYKIQTDAGMGSYYMGVSGVSFSGGLDPGIDGYKFKKTDEKKMGSVWFFRHDYHTAHNAVNTEMPFRVWRYVGNENSSDTPIIDGIKKRKDMVRKRVLDKLPRNRENNPEDTNQVAKIILEQLGGGRFVTMTGAKDLVSGENYLMFTLRRGSAKDGINKVRITLEPSDTYKMEFMKINYKTLDVKIIKEYDDVYNDQLVEIFEKTTSLYTHL